MSVIILPKHFAKPRRPGPTPTRDVTRRVKRWGRRGIFFGGAFGIALGAIFVTISLSTDILAFGAIGTLLVGAVECAVIGGGFAALGAALFANDDVRSRTAQRKRTPMVARRTASIGHQDCDVSLADWPSRWTYPVQATRQALSHAHDEIASVAFSKTDADARLNTIDAWEDGNTGP